MPLRRRVPPAFLLGLSVALVACGLLGGNPRKDDPDIVRPEPPAGAATWASIEWLPVTVDRPPRDLPAEADYLEALAAGPGGYVAVGGNSMADGYLARIAVQFEAVVLSDLIVTLEIGESGIPNQFGAARLVVAE